MIESTSKYSFIGMGVGAIALLLSFTHFWAGPFSPHPTIEQVVAEKAIAIRKATIAALKGQVVEPSHQKNDMNIDKIINIVTVVLAALAIILGVFGYAKKEPMRAAGGAAVLGCGAIAFQLATLALGIIVMLILILAVLSLLGIV